MADVPQLKEAFRGGRRHPRPDRRGAVRTSRPRHPQPGQDDQLRHPLRHLGRGASPAGWACRRKKARRSSTAISSASPASAPISTARSAFAREHGFTRTLFGRKTHFSPTSARPTRRSAPAPSARRSTPRSRAPAPTSSSARWREWTARLPRPGSRMSGCCSRSTTNWCSKCPKAARRRPRRWSAGHGDRRRARDQARRAAGRRGRLGRNWGAAH